MNCVLTSFYICEPESSVVTRSGRDLLFCLLVDQSNLSASYRGVNNIRDSSLNGCLSIPPDRFLNIEF